ncbi:hypothetical protein Ari01nite_81060 [Paractinoplanes rishiriensis]|uniref:Uncharacterized protein n=1 Tax=Paractinoplanes rishiriensis TaxID=1050105 RepID=A0A919MUS5_9ACTN|nr:hypothetical protein Ari01nite_81060 [Actinoplanes rishiriensis]
MAHRPAVPQPAELPNPLAESLGRLEDLVLRAIDPPLNLQGMPATPVRARLTELRRTYRRSG